MKPGKVAREQQIAIFGESGSGKTVLLSSFYGSTQEPLFKESSLFDVVAEDAGQGLRLHQNFLGMKNSATRPIQTRFSSASYSLAIKRRKAGAYKTVKMKQLDDLRLIWHDYPGEWFEEEPSSDEEGQRRLDTFKALLGSDVALILVDGQKLLDNSGEEERYLKALLTNFANGLLKLQKQIGGNGGLVTAPRVWVLALSKSDLLPDLNVAAFRDLMVEKAGGEIVELRNVLAGFLQAPDALSVGEDFVRLSSAKFEVAKIEVTRQVGLDLILPMAAMLPFARFVKWALAMHKGGKVTEHLLYRVTPVALLIGGAVKLPGPFGIIGALIGPNAVKVASKLATEKLRQINRNAKAKHDYLSTMLTNFELTLERAEKEKILIRKLT